MADQPPRNMMNLDLNLGPVVQPSQDDEPQTVNVQDLVDGSVREEIAHQPRVREQLRSVRRPVSVPMETRNNVLPPIGWSGLVTDVGIAAADERPPVMTKINDNGDEYLQNDAVGGDNTEKSTEDESSFFDCNICLALASDPVVTSCGHLFCWPCIYRWLYVHSDAKECPICKGEVTIKTVTPIYSRGKHTLVTEVDPSVRIPRRPQANRIESWRHSIQRNALNLPMFEMIRRLDNRFQLTRDMIPDNPGEVPSNLLLNRIFTSRGMRRAQDAAATASPDAAVHLAQSSPGNSEAGGSTLLSLHSNQAATISDLTSALSSAERLVESYFRSHPADRNQEQPPLIDDRDSMSSIAAIIQSDSHTADTAVEIDSRGSVSTSSSRRRSEFARVSDVDSDNSRTRRRRLQ